MSVWLTIPSKRPAKEANAMLSQWQERGYKVIVQRDPGDELLACVNFVRPYLGYAEAVNALIEWVMAEDPGAEWFIAAGDDTQPDLNHTAEEIAAECSRYFAWNAFLGLKRPSCTFGVMQPTGDRWGDAQGPYIDRVAGSAWIGREFARRVNQGKGPLWPEYFHMGVDEELQAVAEKLGVFWQRPDLIHLHQHWGRPQAGETMGQSSRMPEFLKEANSPEHWARYKALFAERKAADFPGSEPL